MVLPLQVTHMNFEKGILRSKLCSFVSPKYSSNTQDCIRPAADRGGVRSRPLVVHGMRINRTNFSI